jgi:hypothetical protein
MKVLATILASILAFFNQEDGILVSVCGMVSSIAAASITKRLDDILMAFLVGGAGALAGLIVKHIWDYFKKRFSRRRR